uniref:C2H2-type domain-containing protein n=1 Tax=Stomoxys calcitrans TaxID=35570 RepID=A0A1I8PYH0_STOCA
MSGSNVCQLCRNISMDSVRLQDANGRHNQVYDITVKFFHAKFLDAEQGSFTVLCMECWRQISGFNNFQQSVLLLQENLHKEIQKSTNFLSDTIEILSDESNGGVEIKKERYFSNVNTDGGYDVYKVDNPTSSSTIDDDFQEFEKYSPEETMTQPEIPATNTFGSGQLIVTDTAVKFEANFKVERTSDECLEFVENDVSDGCEDTITPLTVDTENGEIMVSHLNEENSNGQLVEHLNGENSNGQLVDLENGPSTSEKCVVRKKSDKEMDAVIAKWRSSLDCYVCDRAFKTFDSIKSHFQKRHPKDEFYILCCGRKLRYRGKMEQHATYHMDPKAFACKLCPKKFKWKATLTNHLVVVHPKEMDRFYPQNPQYKHVCDICGKRYRVPCSLREHYTTHTGQRMHSCEVCNKTFKYGSGLSYHLATEHPEESEKRKKKPGSGIICCPVCQRKFKHHSSMFNHVKSFHPEQFAQRKKERKEKQYLNSNMKYTALSNKCQ